MTAIALLLCAMVFSATPFHEVPDAIPIDAAPKRAMMTPYEWGEAVTGTSAGTLKALAVVESDEDDSAIGDDGVSLGRFQINERFREWNVATFGEYDPTDPYSSAVIAGRLYQYNRARLGTHYRAIAAHRQGARGVKKNGPSHWYVERVIENMQRLE